MEKINIMIKIKMILVDTYIAFGNYKKAKDILINLIEQDNQIYEFHKTS